MANTNTLKTYRIDSIESGLSLCLFRAVDDRSVNETSENSSDPNQRENNCTEKSAPVLFIHGATFPTQLAAGYAMEGQSWMKNLAGQGFDVWGLDFLGYGCSDRYEEMIQGDSSGNALGKAPNAAQDISRAVEFIRKETGLSRISLVSHSRGGVVAGLYATQFPETIDRLVFFAPLIERRCFLVDSVVRLLGINKPQQLSYLDTDVDARLRDFNADVPAGKKSPLAPEIAEKWRQQWLASDSLSSSSRGRNPGLNTVRIPAGYQDDFYQTWTGHGYVEFHAITAPTLIIRGSWDTLTSQSDVDNMYQGLTAAPFREKITIDNATHVLHLESQRFLLYQHTFSFLQKEF